MQAFKKHIKIVSLFIFLLEGITLFAQQLPQYSQYMLNDFAMNPAIAGRNDYWEAKSNNRYQWVGLTDAPRTYMLSLQGPFKSYRMGIGGNLYTDIVGPTRRTGVNLSYAYHIKISSTYKLSLGINGGVVQYAVDGSKITTHDQGDPTLSQNYQSSIAPDIGAGAYFYSKKLYVSLGFPQIYQAKLKFFDDQATKNSLLAPHFYGLVGYKFDVGHDFILEPSVLFQYVSPVPLQVNAGVKLTYQNAVWIGANYRSGDAVSVLVGYMFKNWIMFGYSYDYSITALRKYNSGSHEVMIGLRFSALDKKKAE